MSKIKAMALLCVSLVFIMISVVPLFSILREMYTEHVIDQRYEIHHAYSNSIGTGMVLRGNEIKVMGFELQLREEKTGKKAPLTSFDQEAQVPAGDVVKLHILLNGKEISEPNEMWTSNRRRGSAYFSWLDVLTVKNKATGKKQVDIVQRLTDDNHLNNRKWKIITISEMGKIQERTLTYDQRKHDHLGVKLVDLSQTELIEMGYYSDITKGYPTLVFPFIYPFLTTIIGVLLLILSFVLFFKKEKQAS